MEEDSSAASDSASDSAASDSAAEETTNWTATLDGAAIAVTNDQAEAVVRDVLALQYTACADYAPASLADYGLDQPLYTLTLTYTEEIASDSDSSDASESQTTEKTFTLYLGNVDDSGSVRAFQEGGVQVGLVSSTAYDALLSALADLTAAG